MFQDACERERGQCRPSPQCGTSSSTTLRSGVHPSTKQINAKPPRRKEDHSVPNPQASLRASATLRSILPIRVDSPDSWLPLSNWHLPFEGSVIPVLPQIRRRSSFKRNQSKSAKQQRSPPESRPSIHFFAPLRLRVFAFHSSISCRFVRFVVHTSAFPDRRQVFALPTCQPWPYCINYRGVFRGFLRRNAPGTRRTASLRSYSCKFVRFVVHPLRIHSYFLSRSSAAWRSSSSNSTWASGTPHALSDRMY